MAETVSTADAFDAAGESAPQKRGGRQAVANPPASTVRKELVESQMYETAAKLFALRGFAGTSLQDIADEMGITRPALYYYVKSKDELLAKLVTEITEGNTAQILDVANDPALDSVEKLSRIAYAMVHHCNRRDSCCWRGPRPSSRTDSRTFTSGRNARCCAASLR